METDHRELILNLARLVREGGQTQSLWDYYN